MFKTKCPYYGAQFLSTPYEVLDTHFPVSDFGERVREECA